MHGSHNIPIVKKNAVKDGDILVPLRLITNSALLLDKKITIDEGRFLDFCTFITAFTLHERILTLPVDHIPNEVLNTSLFSYLTDESLKILNELDWDIRIDFEPEIRNEIELLLEQKISKDDFDDFLDEEKFELYHNFDQNRLNSQRKVFIDQVIKIIKDNDWNREVVYAADEEDELAFRVRTALYTKISETLSIPLILDLTRIPIIERYHARIQKSLRMHIETITDDIAMTQLNIARKITGRWPVPVPNPVTQFLNQYSTPNIQPGDVLENMRNDFDAVRGRITQWENKLRQIENIGPGAALEVLSQVHSKLGSLQDEQSVSDMFLSFAPAMVPPVDPGKIIELAKKGYDLYKWLLNRKQMSYFKTGMDEAKKSVKQRDLLRNAFDYYLTDTQTERFLYLSNYLEKLTEPLTNR